MRVIHGARNPGQVEENVAVMVAPPLTMHVDGTPPISELTSAHAFGIPWGRHRQQVVQKNPLEGCVDAGGEA